MRPSCAVLVLAWFALDASCSGQGCSGQGCGGQGCSGPDHSTQGRAERHAADGGAENAAAHAGVMPDAGAAGVTAAASTAASDTAASDTAASDTAASDTAASDTAAARAELDPALRGNEAPAARHGRSPRRRATRRCPEDMVDVGGKLCVDRYESYLVDGDSARVLSPFYHPTRDRAKLSYDYWSAPRPAETPLFGVLSPATALPDLPTPPAWELTHELRPRAQNRVGMRPQGYMSGVLARQACENAGKRLCREAEWVRACRGEQNRDFPYGASYERGVCNVDRDGHPAAILHGNASIGHRDPRLNLVADAEGPLLRLTGSLPRCKSQWGGDAIYDLVGNLDEWVDDARGVFVGGFYSRQTRAGCAARVSAHPKQYFDYSLGVRCCK